MSCCQAHPVPALALCHCLSLPQSWPGVPAIHLPSGNLEGLPQAPPTRGAAWAQRPSLLIAPEPPSHPSQWLSARGLWQPSHKKLSALPRGCWAQACCSSCPVGWCWAGRRALWAGRDLPWAVPEQLPHGCSSRELLRGQRGRVVPAHVVPSGRCQQRPSPGLTVTAGRGLCCRGIGGGCWVPVSPGFPSLACTWTRSFLAAGAGHGQGRGWI